MSRPDIWRRGMALGIGLTGYLFRFLCGRVSFLENGARKTSARFPSVVIVFRWRAGEMKKPPHIWWWKWRKTPNNGEQKGAAWAVREKKPPGVVAPLFRETA